MPDEFNNNVLEYASAQFGTQETTQEVETAMETTTETTTTESTQSPEMGQETQSAETTQTTQIAPETVASEPDYNKWLEEQTGGTFKDVETFKSALPKFSEYDSLLTQKAELEEKLNVKPFQNEFVEKLNDFYKSGASEDQIKNFIKVSSVDLEKLSPVEVKIAAMVKDGYKEEIAKAIVEQEYPIDSYDEGSTERIILEEKLRVSSQKDLDTLKQYKADISKIDNPLEQLKAQQEQERLTTIAQEEQYKNQVSQVVPKIAEVFTGLGEVVIKPGKEGESEPMKMSFDYSEDFKSKVPDMINSYFLDTKSPISEQSVAEAREYINANYLANNIESILQSNTRHVEAITWEKAVNKYENRTGLPPESTNVTVDNTQAEQASFLQRVARGG